MGDAAVEVAASLSAVRALVTDPGRCAKIVRVGSVSRLLNGLRLMMWDSSPGLELLLVVVVKEMIGLEDPVCPFQLSGGIDDYFYSIRSIVVDAASADGFREVVKHGPWCPRQVAQVAVLATAQRRRRSGHG